MKKRADSDSEIPMVVPDDDDDLEQTEYNAIDCNEDDEYFEEEEIEDEMSGDLGLGASSSTDMKYPRHLMRLLRT